MKDIDWPLLLRLFKENAMPAVKAVAVLVIALAIVISAFALMTVLNAAVGRLWSLAIAFSLVFLLPIIIFTISDYKRGKND